MSLTATLKVSCAANLSSALDLVNAVAPLTFSKTQEFANGTGANQATQIFSDTRTLAASANEELDLAGGLTNALGTTLTFTKIKALVVSAAAGNTNDVLVGGAASNGFASWVGDPTDIVKVKPGGTLVLVAPDANGYAVTASTGDLLKLANSSSGTSVSYDIIVIGTT